MLLLPSIAAGKAYITEVTRLVNAWNNNSPLADISIKAIHLMPGLLLQKSSKTLKMKDHIKALERRMELWQKGELKELLFEAETIQKRLESINKKKDIAQLSKELLKLMSKAIWSLEAAEQ